MKKFYAHLVEYESILIELDELDLSDKQKVHLSYLVDSHLHHSILDAVLSELPEEDKDRFLKHLREDNSDKIWEMLNERVDHIEDKIKETADKVKEELRKDIKEAKNSTKKI